MSAIEKAARAIRNADGLLIGASNGLSIAEGYNIFADNEMFRSQFGEFQAKYGVNCVLDGIFYPYPSSSERARFFAALIRRWIDDYRPSRVMKNLSRIVGDKDYFIVTSNGDTHLELSGFAPENVWEIEGTFISAADNAPVRDKSRQLREFIGSREKLAFLEIGIGARNQLIKAPMTSLAAQMPESEYLIFNLPREILVSPELKARAVPIEGNLEITLEELARRID